MSRLATLALAGLAAVAISAPALAADLLFPSEAPALISRPMELGSGWYLRGDAGWTRDNEPQLSTDIAVGNPQRSWVIDFGAGYKFNNWLRSDLTFSYNKLRNTTQTSGASVTCPYQLTGLTTQGANPVELGYLWDTVHDTCTPRQTADLRKADMLLNGYIDLGTWTGLTPYVGAGIGISMLNGTTKLDYYKQDGTIYGPDLTPTAAQTFPHIWVDVNGTPIGPQPAVAFGKQNWSRVAKQTNYNFAWALMAGVAIDISDHAKLDIGYRYLNSGTYTSLPSMVTGQVVKSKITSQQINVGFRYMID